MTRECLKLRLGKNSNSLNNRAYLRSLITTKYAPAMTRSNNKSTVTAINMPTVIALGGLPSSLSRFLAPLTGFSQRTPVKFSVQLKKKHNCKKCAIVHWYKKILFGKCTYVHAREIAGSSLCEHVPPLKQKWSQLNHS